MKNHSLCTLTLCLLLGGLATWLSCNCGHRDGTISVAAPITKAPPGITPGKPWSFAVSGDSRNCGDVVMPAIAQGAAENHAQFYWHLGDLRAIYRFDEDMLQINNQLNIIDYETQAWDDFIENQVTPFKDRGIPFYLGIGNHETIPPKTRDEFIIQFADWLDQPVLQEQRLLDNQEWRKQGRISGANRNARQLRTYYHWRQDGVDFINMDNASPEQFDSDQMKWFRNVVRDDADSDSIRTVVVGMHAALPDSISRDHSMNQWLKEEWAQGELTGREVYATLRGLRDANKQKNVYILASHSHYFMDGIFNTPYWKTLGSVLPGWIIGTAGAERYKLPNAKNDANDAKTDVYGYLLATVNPPSKPTGTIEFQFKRISQVPQAVRDRYTQKFVNWCFTQNSQSSKGKPGGKCCGEDH